MLFVCLFVVCCLLFVVVVVVVLVVVVVAVAVAVAVAVVVVVVEEARGSHLPLPHVGSHLLLLKVEAGRS